MRDEHRVVAGLDGSTAARAAADWAAQDAWRRGATLRLVHVAQPTLGGGYPAPTLTPAKAPDAILRWARRMLADVAAELTAVRPGLVVQTRTRQGMPGSVLVKESRQAVLTVVGSHGREYLADALCGSVATRLAGHGHGCVVIVPSMSARSRDTAADRVGPVVVGVDGSAQAEAAIGFAFDEAAMRGASLVAVNAWNGKAADVEERRVLAEQLAGWAKKYPKVTASEVLVRGRPAPAVLHYVADAEPQLLVVGSRGRGGFARLVLGSTGMAVVRRAACPVAVVRGQ
ncbi:MAG TPA: universal stress protein [Nakamurella sp.]